LPIVVAGSVGYWVACAPAGLPAAGSAEYRETVRVFYRGLASLEVGLLSDARDQFVRASELAPREPAIHANLAVAQVGVGDDEGATTAPETAYTLAPDSAEVAFLQGQLASFSGRSVEAAAQYRRAAALDDSPPQTRAEQRHERQQPQEMGGAPTHQGSSRNRLCRRPISRPSRARAGISSQG